MKIWKKIFKQTFWQISGKVVTSASTLIILGLVTRNYGEAGTGIFTLALTYLAIFYLLADFGFNAHVLKKLKLNNLPSAEQNLLVKTEWRKLLGTRIAWSAILVVLAVGLLPFWPFTTQEFAKAVMFGSLAIIGSAVFTTCNLIFQSRLRYDLSILSSSLGVILSLGLFIYPVSLKYPIHFLFLAQLLGWAVIALTSLVLVKKFLPTVTAIFDRVYIVNLFKHSWPIAATLSLNVVYFRADSFMVAYFKSMAEAGIYNLAYQVFQSVLVLPTFIMNSYYPLMLKSLKEIKFVGVSLFFLSFLGTVFTIILAPLIIKTLTGAGFAGSTQSLQILSLGFPAYFLSSLMMWLMVSKGRYQKMLLIYSIGLIFNLILNLSYIPRYSYLAACWITVISEYLILILQIIILRR
ncbi:oligosaccharide flippase family protein [Candidatus Daviesbacteria bacterium]|nr:oligosaccharide flippase family protein [Candidatus Daviesbacteria bacterium]